MNEDYGKTYDGGLKSSKDGKIKVGGTRGESYLKLAVFVELRVNFKV